MVSFVSCHNWRLFIFALSHYLCNVSTCPNNISLNVSISFIFSRRLLCANLMLFVLAVDNEFDCNDTVLPYRFKDMSLVASATGLYDCSTSIQWVLSSGFSALKYHTQLFTATSKRHSSNSWLCEQNEKRRVRTWKWFAVSVNPITKCTLIVALCKLIAPLHPKSLSNSLQLTKMRMKKKWPSAKVQID